MTPQQKAKEIAEKLYETWGDSAYATGAEYGANEMYEWCKEDMLKEYREELNKIYKHYLAEQKQQLIDKAAEWFSYRFPHISKEAFEKFKEDMKGEEL